MHCFYVHFSIYGERMTTEQRPKSKGEGNQPLVDYAIHIATKGVRDLRKKTHLDEANFRRIAPYAHARCSAVFAYRALDEIMKAGMNLMQWREYFSEGMNFKDENDDVGRSLSRLAIETVIDDQHARIRKMTELLVECILFGDSTSEDLYRDYFLIHELSDKLRLQRDRQEYFAFTSENTAWTVKRLYEDIVHCEETGLDPRSRWYLKHPAKAQAKWREKGPGLASFSDKYKLAINIAKPREHMILGKSYLEAYHWSSDIHFTPHDTSSDFRTEDALSNMPRVALLLLNIMYRCQDIVGTVPHHINKQLRDVLDVSRSSDEFMQSLRDPSLEIGDIAIVHDDIAEIVDMRTSSYGFTAVQVRYLDKPPIQEIPYDWFASFQVRRCAKHEDVERAAIDARKLIIDETSAPEGSAFPHNNELLDYVKQGMVQIYRIQYQALLDEHAAEHSDEQPDSTN